MPAHSDNFSRDLDWNLLKRFHQIAEAGNITRAAEEINRKQPALSLALKRLEDWLGVVLCERGPGGFRLTDEGRIVVDLCLKLEEGIADLPRRLDQIETEIRGLLRIMMVSNLTLPAFDEAIARFHQKYPAIEIAVEVATWTDVVNAVLQRKIDIGIAPGEVQRAELDYLHLFTEVHRPFCGAGHHLFGHRFTDPKELAKEAFILTGADEGHDLTKYRLEYGLGSKAAGVSEYLDEAKRLTITGVGLCFLPEGYAQSDVDAGRLWPLIEGTNVPTSKLYVMTFPQAEHRVARDLFIAEVTAAIGPERG